jgi:hypothetical protein
MNSTGSRVMTPMRLLCLESRQRKAHLAVVETEEPSVGDGDAVGVAGQILQHLLGAAEWWFGVHDPLLVAQEVEQRPKWARLGKIRQSSRKTKSTAGISLLQKGQYLAAEHAAEHVHRQKEVGLGCDPAGVIESQSAGRNETVQVRMMSQVLRPAEAAERRNAAAIQARIAQAAGIILNGS